jgi:CheY-like chemotaxis protein
MRMPIAGLAQVLLNLGGNATKHGATHVVLRVTLVNASATSPGSLHGWAASGHPQLADVAPADVSDTAIASGLQLDVNAAHEAARPELGRVSPWEPVVRWTHRMCASRRRRASVAPAPHSDGEAPGHSASMILSGAGPSSLLPFRPAGRTAYRVLLDSDGTTMTDALAARWARVRPQLVARAGAEAAPAPARGGDGSASGDAPGARAAPSRRNPSPLDGAMGVLGPESGSLLSPQPPSVVATRSGGPPHATGSGVGFLRSSGGSQVGDLPPPAAPPLADGFRFGRVAVLRMEVVDNGRGIPAAAQGALFSQFAQVGAVQAGAAQTAALKGTGLGLFIVKQLAERHGGRVGVTSSGVPGQPTSFWLEVPVRTCAMAPAPAEEASSSAREASVHAHGIPQHSADLPGAVGVHPSSARATTYAEPTAGGVGLTSAPTHALATLPEATEASHASATSGDAAGQRKAAEYTSPLLQAAGPHVVVVDDSATLRRMLTRALQRAFPRAAVHSADGGAAALEVLRALRRVGKEPSVVLLDYNMPGMSGLETVRELRARGAQARVVGVTGNAMGPDTDAFLAGGCDCVLTKPVTSGDLATAVAPYIDVELSPPVVTVASPPLSLGPVLARMLTPHSRKGGGSSGGSGAHTHGTVASRAPAGSSGVEQSAGDGDGGGGSSVYTFARRPHTRAAAVVVEAGSDGGGGGV